MNTDPYYIIRTPVLTEESTLQMETRNQYVFKVDPRSTKRQIRDAVERMFNVGVVSVNTMNYAGKQFGQGRIRGYRASWKKAVVTLRPGEKIDLL